MQGTDQTEYPREIQDKLYAQWKASSQSQAAFCRAQNIPYNKFSYWHKREERIRLKNSPTFAHAKIAKSNAPVGRLVLPSGMRVEIFSEAVLLSLLKEAMLST